MAAAEDRGRDVGLSDLFFFLFSPFDNAQLGGNALFVLERISNWSQITQNSTRLGTTWLPLGPFSFSLQNAIQQNADPNTFTGVPAVAAVIFFCLDPEM